MLFSLGWCPRVRFPQDGAQLIDFSIGCCPIVIYVGWCPLVISEGWCPSVLFHLNKVKVWFPQGGVHLRGFQGLCQLCFHQDGVK